MSILIVGSLGLDTIKTPFGEVKEALGGSAVYISLAASYFSNSINLVGVVGSDFPQDYVKLLKEHRIDLNGLQIIDGGKTFRYACRYDVNMNDRESLKTELNVFEFFNPIIPESYRNSEFIILGNIDPELQLNVLQQINNPKFIICDTMNFWIERKYEALQETIKNIDMLLVNDSEARMLANESNLILAVKKIQKMGPKKIVVKKGEHGALLVSDDTMFYVPAYPLEKVIDPTGAGDSFAGGMIGYLSKSNIIDETNIKKAVVYGSVIASFCVEEFSVNSLVGLSLDIIKYRIKKLFDLTHFEVD